MKFAENNRISHRQLYRQMILAFVAPFLLCLPGTGGINGRNGMAGTLAALVLLAFYVIFLVRLAPLYGNLKKNAGPVWARAVGVFFLVYVLLTAGFLLTLFEEIVPVSLVADMPGKWLSFFALLVCAMGTHRGMQRRGRIAEVSGGLLLWSVLLLMVLCVGQGKTEYLQEMAASAPLEPAGFLRGGYGILCAFSGIGLLPFVLVDVEKQGSAGKSAALAIFTLGGILLGMQVLLPAVLGWDRVLAEKYPVLPLLSGADLPGNVLARFDVLWMGFLIYSLLFSVGSLLHYGHQIIRQTSMGTGRFWMAAVIYILSAAEFKGMGIEEYYGVYLGYIFVPGLALIQLLLMLRGKGRRKKKAAAAAVLALCMVLCGCAVEPEKRMYPLALGVDSAQEGYAMTYGMPRLPKATGQDKSGSEGSTTVLRIRGSDFQTIEAIYNRSQQKYLDMGHVQVLVLGENLIGDGRWQKVLEYLKEEPFVGEDMYVFRAESPADILAWTGDGGTTAGEYIRGLMENRMSGQQNGVTLRDLYYRKYKEGMLADLPEIRIQDKQLQIF